LTAIITWIFVYRKVHTCFLHKIHIDNIAVVLPLVTWFVHVLSVCDVTWFIRSRKTANKLTSGRKQVCKHRPTGSWTQPTQRSRERSLSAGS